MPPKSLRADGAQLVLAMLVQRVTFDMVPGQAVASEPLITVRRGRVIGRAGNMDYPVL